MTEVHSCSYYCDRPECIKAQRDELRSRLESMTDRELMQRSLEALEWVNTSVWLEDCYHAFDEEVAALRERLAQPEQEPVAWVCYGSTSDEKHAVDYQQEDIDAIPVGTMLYTTPPQREWVGLTQEEKNDLSMEMVKGRKSVNWLTSRIEDKLKERNT